MNAAPVLASAMLSPSSSLLGQGTGLCAGGQSKSVGMTAAPAYGATILPGSGNSSGGFSIGGSFSGGGGLSAGGGGCGGFEATIPERKGKKDKWEIRRKKTRVLLFPFPLSPFFFYRLTVRSAP